MTHSPYQINPNAINRFIVDLEGNGRVFKQFLRNSFIDDVRKIDRGDGAYTTDLQYVYTESVNQFMIIMTPNLQDTMVKLMALPDVRYFKHIAQFSSPDFVHAFTQAFKEFALMLLGIIQRRIGLKLEFDYILDSITDDYAIISIFIKGYQNYA